MCDELIQLLSSSKNFGLPLLLSLGSYDVAGMYGTSTTVHYLEIKV
jgi:hypothetical protein